MIECVSFMNRGNSEALILKNPGYAVAIRVENEDSGWLLEIRTGLHEERRVEYYTGVTKSLDFGPRGASNAVKPFDITKFKNLGQEVTNDEDDEDDDEPDDHEF